MMMTWLIDCYMEQKISPLIQRELSASLYEAGFLIFLRFRLFKDSYCNRFMVKYRTDVQKICLEIK